MRFLQTRTGFTLMELLAVVMIVAVLSGMAIGTYRQAAERSHFNEGLQMGAALTEAINRYYYENFTASESDRKTPTLAALDMAFTKQGTCQVNTTDSICMKGRYFEVYYDSSDSTVYAQRIKEGAAADYRLVFYPVFTSKELEKCEALALSSGASASGKSLCNSMGYTEQVIGTTNLFAKPYDWGT